MFLAIREIRHDRLRFGLITGMLILVATLVFILSGLANGLSTDSAAAIERLPGNAIVLQYGSDLVFDRSSLPANTLDHVRAVKGVDDAAALGVSMGNTQRGRGEIFGVAFFGVDPNGFLAPPVSRGDRLASGTNGIVIDRSLADKGLAVGDTLTAGVTQTELTVVGVTTGRTYLHTPVVYLPLPLWQQIQFGEAAGVTSPLSAIVVQAERSAIKHLPTAVDGTMIGSKSEVVAGLPGRAQESGTLLMIQAFLLVIGAGIIAAFFYIIALQKTSELGVLKAIGASTGYLAKSLLGQVALVSVGGIVIGMLIAFLVASIMPDSLPFLLDRARILLFAIVLLAVAVIGTFLSLRRVAAIDPLDAISHPG